MRVGAQAGSRDPGVAPVVLGPGDAEAVTQAVKLLGVDGMHGEAAVQQHVHHRPVRHLDRHRHRAGAASNRHQPVAHGRQACAVVRKSALADNGASNVTHADLVLLGSPIDAGEPAPCHIRHGPCAPVSHEPPRRLANPCTGARGATSYWTSVVANSPGHMSNFGAQGTRGSVAAPGELARLASLQPGRPDVLEGTGGQAAMAAARYESLAAWK